MPKKKIGKRGSFLRKKKDVTPLTTTGEKPGGAYQMTCVETWDAKKITLDEVREKWFEKYHPAGYGTTVSGAVADGILTTTMTRAKSCD